MKATLKSIFVAVCSIVALVILGGFTLLGGLLIFGSMFFETALTWVVLVTHLGLFLTGVICVAIGLVGTHRLFHWHMEVRP